MSRLSLLSPDAALVRQALADEPRAFETLVRRYQRQAHAIARAAGVRADSLEDVVQEAFLQAFRGLCNLRTPDSFGSWFLRIVRNLSLRNRHTRGPTVDSGVVDPDSLAAPTSPVAEVYEERERLWRSVDRLPEGIREAIFLYYYEGQSTRRVARSLGVSRSAVKTRLKRGRDQLRERLWREFGSALRGDVPSAGEWRRQGRRMALLVIASANRDLAAASTVSVSGSGGGSFLGGSLSTAVTTGALIMKAKTVLIALTLASLALAGGWMALRDRDGSGPGGTRDLAGAGGSLAEPGPIATTSDPDELPAAPAVTGSPVTGISGLVVYEDSGLAVPGARVAATLKGASERASITSSGDDGAYLLTGLEPGEYRLWSWKEDWAIARPPDPVEVVKGEVTRDVHQVLAPGVVITGEVLEEASDRPIAGATVRFSELHYTFAGESGGFRLEGVPGGLHRLVARGAGFAPVWALADVAHGDNPFVRFALASGGVIEGTVFDPGGEPVEGAAVSGGTGSAETDGSGRYRLEGVPLHESSGPVSASIARSFVGVATFPGFEPGETRATLDLHLERGYVLAGRVVDPGGEPVPGVALHLHGSMIFSMPRATDADGRFAIEGASERMFFLGTRKKGFASSTTSLRDIPPEERESIEIALGPGHFVAGRVVDTSGEPLDDAWVNVEAKLQIPPAHVARTDEDGRFRIEDLPAELDTIGAGRPGYAGSMFNPVEADRDDIELVLEESGQIRGVVVDRETGEPVRPILVKVSFPDDARLRRENQLKKSRGGLISSLNDSGLRFGETDGNFSVRNCLARGIYYKLIVQADGYRETVLDGVEAWALSASREPLRVELERGKTLTGKVVGADSGKPIPRVKVSHLGATRASRGVSFHHWMLPPGKYYTVRVAASDSEGEFTIDGLPDEPGHLLLENPGHARTAIFNVPDMISSRRDLVYFPAGSVELDGTDNAFELDIAKSGSHIITVHGDESQRAWGWLGPLDLGGGGSPGRVTVPLGGPGRLDVVVRDSTDGSPLESVRVMLGPRLPVPIRPNAMTDSRGRAVIESLPAGPYQLHVSGGERADVVELVEIPAGRIEKTIELGPASWMVVDLDVPPGYAKKHAVVALVVSGDDPGWPYRSREGDLPMASQGFAGKPMRIKVRPGAYRVRFEVKESYVNSPSLAVHEADVVVPAGGEAAVRVPLGG